MESDRGPAREFLGLARLTYADDSPERWQAATDLLLAHPDLPRTDVHVAAALADVGALGALLDDDPGLADAPGPDGWTPLMSLTYARVPQDDPYGAARLLLDAGADPDGGVLLGGNVPPFTVLTGCFGEGEGGPFRQPRHPQGEALAELLLDAGADPNDGQTLYNRMFSRDDSHLRLLLAHGLGRGDPSTSSGQAAWQRRLGERQDSPQRMVADQVDWARDHGLTDRLELFAAYGFTQGAPADPSTGSGQARSSWREPADAPPISRAGTPDGVRRVAAEGADLDARLHGRTLLHHAAWIGDVELVRALLEVGADPQVLDDEHHATPLGWAEWSYAVETAALLRPITRTA